MDDRGARYVIRQTQHYVNNCRREVMGVCVHCEFFHLFSVFENFYSKMLGVGSEYIVLAGLT